MLLPPLLPGRQVSLLLCRHGIRLAQTWNHGSDVHLNVFLSAQGTPCSDPLNLMFLAVMLVVSDTTWHPQVIKPNMARHAVPGRDFSGTVDPKNPAVDELKGVNFNHEAAGDVHSYVPRGATSKTGGVPRPRNPVETVRISMTQFMKMWCAGLV